MKFAVVKQTPISTPYCFGSYEHAKDHDFKEEDYVMVFVKPNISADTADYEICENLFSELNSDNNRPCRSMAVSDLVVIINDETREHNIYYCDIFGFKKVEVEKND